MEEKNLMDTDFIEAKGLFSINPQQVTDIKYYKNCLYFHFNSDTPSMRLKFPNEDIARESLENFKMAIARKVID